MAWTLRRSGNHVRNVAGLGTWRARKSAERVAGRSAAALGGGLPGRAPPRLRLAEGWRACADLLASARRTSAAMAGVLD
eukprot:4387350-Prymnesium_polylepis.1